MLSEQQVNRASQMTPDVLPASHDEHATLEATSPAPARQISTRFARGLSQDWITAAVLVSLDVLSWMGIYGLAAHLRGDAFYVRPLRWSTMLFLIWPPSLKSIIATPTGKQSCEMKWVRLLAGERLRAGFLDRR
jgi:hypothetical protein